MNQKPFHFPLSTFHLLLAAILLFAACKPEDPSPDPNPSSEKIEMPRRIATHDGKIYVTCYRPASVLRIDTATRKVEAKCLLGNYNPEGIAVAGGKLFAVSSWNQTENGDFVYDDKVYVIDLTSFTVSTTLTVGLNPQQVKAVDDGHVIVNYVGNYSDQPAGTAVIDATTLAVTQTGVAMTSMSVEGGKVYGYNTTYDADWNTTANYLCYDVTNNSTTTILENCNINNPYSITALGGNLYITTYGDNYTTNGDVVSYTMNGTLRWQCEAGALPSKLEALGDGNAYVLNEGNYGSNNSSLSLLNLTTGSIDNSVFSTANGRGLGDLAQDVVVYGTKAYVTVSGSNTLEVVSLTDNKSTQIKL